MGDPVILEPVELSSCVGLACQGRDGKYTA